MYTINCKGKLLVIEHPLVMGIINATPDSFFKGDLHHTNDELLQLAAKMIEDGASMLDIGGQSSRPGSTRIDAKEESDRVLPIIELIHRAFPETIISVDTYHSTVAKNAVDSGASIVNDISGGDLDSNMIQTVASLHVPYICMHMKGTPETMQQQPNYDNVTKEVFDYFIDKLDICKQAGIVDIVLDPGFGFGKTFEQNFTILQQLNTFGILDRPILAGLSRKGMIYKSLGISPAEALNGTTALHMIALQNGASILRVHDVKEAMECIQLYELYKKATL